MNNTPYINPNHQISDETGLVYPFNLKYIHPDFRLGCDEFLFEKDETEQHSFHVTDHFIWFRVLEGQLCFEINMEKIYIGKGDTLFINSRVPHTLRGVTIGPAKVRILIAASDTVTVPFLDRQIREMIDDNMFSSTVIHPVSDLFSYEMDTILDLIRHKPEAYEFEVAARYISLLRKYIRIHNHTNPDQTVPHDADMESLREMLAFIGEHHQEEITVDQIAAAGQMSRSKCSRIFRSLLGRSPIEHVLHYRLQKSIFLLKNTDLPFSEISSLCGFNQQSYFNRQFVREYGMTPREMRREAKKTQGE